MEISQHIKDLLLTHDRVILSDFGAFIAKYKPAKVNEENNTMSPPTKEIIFDPKIIKDGGLLEKHMVEKEKITAEEARVQIEEYVKTVKSKLNAGKKVKFPELGSFTKIKEGIIMFNYEPSGNLLLDSYGLAKISLPKTAKAAHDKTSKTTKTSAVKSTAPKTNDSEKKTFNKTGIIVAAVALFLILSVVSIFIFKPEWIAGGKNKTLALYHSIFKGGKNKDTLKVNEVKPDTTVKDISENVNENTDENTNEKKDTVKKQVEPVKEEVTPPVNNKNKQTVAETNANVLTPQKGKSYIIIASLPNEELAEKEKKRFNRLGIDVQIVVADASKYRLTLGVYSSPKEAVAAYEDFHAQHKDIHPWLWEN